MFYTKEEFFFFFCSHSSNTLDSSSFLIEVFSRVLVFGFSLCSAGWQLFYAAIWVVGFLPAPSYVLDKVRQVSMEMWKMPQSGQNSKQAKIVSVKLMAPVPSITEHYPAVWLLLCCYFSMIWCLYSAFCFFPFIPPWPEHTFHTCLTCTVLCCVHLFVSPGTKLHLWWKTSKMSVTVFSSENVFVNPAFSNKSCCSLFASLNSCGFTLVCMNMLITFDVCCFQPSSLF